MKKEDADTSQAERRVMPGESILVKIFLDNEFDSISEELLYHDFMDEMKSEWKTELIKKKTVLESEIEDIINLFSA